MKKYIIRKGENIDALRSYLKKLNEAPFGDIVCLTPEEYQVFKRVEIVEVPAPVEASTKLIENAVREALEGGINLYSADDMPKFAAVIFDTLKRAGVIR